jgi:hypothetical protein
VQKVAEQKNTYSEQFRYMQEQLNKWIRHHQEVKR